MRLLLIYIFIVLFINAGMAQVGIGTATPHPSAGLDVTSTTTGLLPPRMTTVQRDAIVSPSPGLIIFNTTTQSLEIFTAYGWSGIQIQIPPRKLLGGTQSEETYSIQKTADGGYIIAGTSNSSLSGDVTTINNAISGTGSSDYWIIKLDASRNISWNKLFGGTGNETAKSIQQTADGGYIVAGYSSSSTSGDVSGINNGLTDYWIVKLDGLGRIEWEHLIGGSGEDMANSIIETSDRGFIIAGSSSSSLSGFVTDNNHGLHDYWIVKFDMNGNLLWNKLFGGNGDEDAHSITEGEDGNYVVAGNSSSSANGNVTGMNHGGGYYSWDYWIVRFSTTGVILWNKLLGGFGDDEAQSIQPAPDASYIVAGYSTSSASGNVTSVSHSPIGGSTDSWILKLDRFGNITWNKLIGGDNYDQAYSIKKTNDGGYIFTGFSSSSANGDVTDVNHGETDYWIVKLDGLGNIIWNKLAGGNDFDYPYSIVESSDGGFIVAGFTFSSFNGDVTGGNHSANSDLWIIKLGSNGYLY